jgi:hypothetical protein
VKNIAFMDVTPCGSCKNRRLEGTYHAYVASKASVVPISPVLVTLMIEGLSSTETSILTRATRRNIP